MSPTTTEITVAGVTLQVSYEYYKGYRAPRDPQTGWRETPDEPPSVTVGSVKSSEDFMELLPNKIIELIEEKIWESMKQEREE